MNNSCPLLIGPLHIQNGTLINRMNPIRIKRISQIMIFRYHSEKKQLCVIVVKNVFNSTENAKQVCAMLVGFQKCPSKNSSVNFFS